MDTPEVAALQSELGSLTCEDEQKLMSPSQVRDLELAAASMERASMNNDLHDKAVMDAFMVDLAPYR